MASRVLIPTVRRRSSPLVFAELRSSAQGVRRVTLRAVLSPSEQLPLHRHLAGRVLVSSRPALLSHPSPNHVQIL